MKDWSASLITGVTSVVGWILMVILLGFVARINYEIFMFGWGFIK